MVDWKVLKDFMKRAEQVKSQEEWQKLRNEAEEMSESTQALAIEHLYLYAREDV